MLKDKGYFYVPKYLTLFCPFYLSLTRPQRLLIQHLSIKMFLLQLRKKKQYSPFQLLRAITLIFIEKRTFSFSRII